MLQAQRRFPTFEDYLAYDDGSDQRYEWIDGVLRLLPPESESNDFLARSLLFLLVSRAIVPLRQIVIHTCEVQVPVLHPGDAANRFPDLVILDEIHLALTQKRLTIRIEMPPPRLVAEVVSPGKQNYARDYDRKRDQYAARGIPEYWLIDPQMQAILVLHLVDGAYQSIGEFRDQQLVRSPSFPSLNLTPAQLF